MFSNRSKCPESVALDAASRTPLALAQLSELYASEDKGHTSHSEGNPTHIVPAHRFAFAMVQACLNAGASDAETNDNTVEVWRRAGLNWHATASAALQTKLDVSYEQLERLTLEGTSGAERLVATLRIKQSAGYSGGLCTPGSPEHVAFWADWDHSGKYTYLGAGDVRVYDIAVNSAKGLVYSVMLPVDLRYHRPADNAREVTFRAVLSWAVPPSDVDPDALPTWGNHLDASLQIQPDVTTQGGTSPTPEARNIASASRGFGSLGAAWPTFPAAPPLRGSATSVRVHGEVPCH